MIGVLHFTSTYRFPSNLRGTPQYRWTSLDSDNGVTELLVASSNKYLKNQYAIVQFKTAAEPRPIGIIIKILGEIGNTYAEIEARLYYRQVAFKKWKFQPPPLIDLFARANPMHIDYQHLTVYSVDPDGCRDVDDAFSYLEKEHRIGIHIADVSYLLQEYGLLEMENFQERYSSVYLPDHVNHMIPESLSADQASLLPGQPRFAWTLWLDLSPDNHIIDWKFERTIIKSHRAFTYDEAETAPEITLISKIVRELGSNMLQLKHEQWSMHEMVEVLMIITNHFAATFIHEHSDKGIYRTHTGKLEDVIDVDPELNKFLNILNSQAAQYTFDTGQYYHYGLKIDKYTHFTSPIRRFSDIYVHILLSNIIFPHYGQLACELQIDLKKINDFHHRVKLFQRDLDKIKLISLIGTHKEHRGYIIDISNDHILDVYFSTFKILVSFPIIHKNIIGLFQISNQPTYLEISYNNSTISIPKRKLMTFNLFPQPDEIYLSKKIKCEIPALATFLQDQHSFVTSDI